MIVFLLAALLLPNPHLTPGVARPMAITEICATQWNKDARHVTQKMKRKVCAAYGAKDCPGSKWEIDHLISRELGGADDIKNLWPQPIKEARKKDHLENTLHRMVCAKKIPLQDAQKCLAVNWIKCLEKML